MKTKQKRPQAANPQFSASFELISKKKKKVFTSSAHEYPRDWSDWLSFSVPVLFFGNENVVGL